MNEQQCCMLADGVQCEARGIPESGYDFYVCPDCLDKVEILCNAYAAVAEGRN